MDHRVSPGGARQRPPARLGGAAAPLKSRTRFLARFLAALVLVTGCLVAGVGPVAAAAEAQVGSADLTSGLKLLMVEEAGCGFCARWMAEVAPGYRLSSEGRQAPLVVRDRFDPEVKQFGRIVFTPTFILLRGGVERGRILGYPGADFFWSLISDMLRRETAVREDASARGFDGRQ